MKAGDGVASRYLYKSNVRPKELSLRAAKAAWQSVTPAAIGGAVLRIARKRIPTAAAQPRNDKGRGPVPYFHIFRNDELATP